MNPENLVPDEMLKEVLLLAAVDQELFDKLQKLEEFLKELQDEESDHCLS